VRLQIRSSAEQFTRISAISAAPHCREDSATHPQAEALFYALQPVFDTVDPR
jgi:hypothetical protein